MQLERDTMKLAGQTANSDIPCFRAKNSLFGTEQVQHTGIAARIGVEIAKTGEKSQRFA
jgi:hypothetical protein